MYSASLILDEVRKGFLPPVKLSISEWAEENITISSGNNKGMKFNKDFMSYQNGILECVNDPSIEKVCIEASARIGKTFIVSTILAHFIAHNPESILYMRPTDQDIQKYSKEELQSLIDNTPGLRKAINAKTETYNFKQFPGGSLRLCGSNSASGLAGYGCKIALLDEIDKYQSIPGFGNPLDLAEERTAEFALYGRKLVFISTPTDKDAENKIDWLYQTKSDKRIYVVPCVHCNHEQELSFNNVKFEHCRKNLDSIYYECESCKGHINDSQRLTMMRKGKWIITRPEIKGFAGFKINRLYSPLATMESIVKDFLNKKDNWLMLKQFINDCLGEAWDTNKESKATTNELAQRREHYTSEVPQGVAFLTMAVDVQGNPEADKSWLEYLVMGWGRGNENWVIDHDLIYGSPAEIEVWEELLKRVDRTYKTWAETDMKVFRVGIDTQGGYSKEVTAFLKGRSPKIIGLEGKKNKPNAPLITKRKNKKINNHEVGTDTAKDTIYAILSNKEPGPNCCHFNDTLDEEFFLQLMAEKKVERIIGGIKIKKYMQSRSRNEILDLYVYNWYLYNYVLKFHPTKVDADLATLEAAIPPVNQSINREIIVPEPMKPLKTQKELFLEAMRNFQAGNSR